MSSKLIINLVEAPYALSTIVEIVKDLCNLKTKVIAIKVTRTTGTSYDLTKDLYEWFDEFFDLEVPKNGWQLYQDESTLEYYLKGDDVTVFFKDFTW